MTQIKIRLSFLSYFNDTKFLAIHVCCRQLRVIFLMRPYTLYACVVVYHVVIFTMHFYVISVLVFVSCMVTEKNNATHKGDPIFIIGSLAVEAMKELVSILVS